MSCLFSHAWGKWHETGRYTISDFFLNSHYMVAMERECDSCGIIDSTAVEVAR